MSSYMDSKLKLMLEEQEREVASNPPSYHGAYKPSTSREHQPHGYYAPRNSYGYGERHHPRNEHYNVQEPHSPEASKFEKIYNMLKVVVQSQKEIRYAMNEGFDKLDATNRQPFGDYAQRGKYEKGERSNSWKVECVDQESHPSQVSREDENYNLLKELLEEQEKGRIERERQFDSIFTKIEDMAKNFGSQVEYKMEHVEETNTRVIPRVEEKEEMSLPLDKTEEVEENTIVIEESFEEEEQGKDEFLIEAEEAIMEFESQLGCTVDGDLVIRYDDEAKTVCISSDSFKDTKEVVGTVGKNLGDPLESVLVTEFRKEEEEISIDYDETSSKQEATLSDIQEEEESINEFEELFGYPSMEAMNAKFEDDTQRKWVLPTKEEPHVISIAKKEVNKEESKEKEEGIEEPQKGFQEEESPMEKLIDMDFGLISTKEVSIDDPRRIPF